MFTLKLIKTINITFHYIIINREAMNIKINPVCDYVQ